MGVLRRPRKVKVFPSSSSFCNSSRYSLSGLFSAIKLPRHSHAFGLDSLFATTCRSAPATNVEKPAPPPAGDEVKPAEVAEKSDANDAATEKPAEDGKDQSESVVIELKVDMHCEGCARKVKRSLFGLPGVEEVEVDIHSHKVIVKAKSADPLNVRDRVQKKSGRRTQLISPIPPPEDATTAAKPEETAQQPPETKQEEPPKTMVVALKVHMHCERCADEVRKALLKLKGVHTAEADLKKEQVMVTGTIESARLTEYLYKKTGKHAVVVSEEPQPEATDKDKENEKENDKEKNKDGAQSEPAEAPKSESSEQDAPAAPDGGGSDQDPKKIEMMMNMNMNPGKYVIEYDVPPPQLFSDENPNACAIM